MKGFRAAFKMFLETTKVETIEQVNRDALGTFVSGMVKQLDEQTRHGYFAKVATFLPRAHRRIPRTERPLGEL